MSLHFNVLIYYIYWILLHFATDLAEDTLYSIVLCLRCTLLVWSEGLFVLVRSTGNGVHLFASVFCRNWCMWVCQWEYWLWKGNTSEVQTNTLSVLYFAHISCCLLKRYITLSAVCEFLLYFYCVCMFQMQLCICVCACFRSCVVLTSAFILPRKPIHSRLNN